MSQAGVLNVVEDDPQIPTQFVTDSGTAIPIANTLEVLGGTGTTTSGAGNVITITSTHAAFAWNVVTSVSNPTILTAENGYIAKGVGGVVFKLPAAATVGDSFIIVGYGNLWQVTQNAGQTIFFGVQQTTAGVGGSVTATMIKDTIYLVCVTNNTEFQIIDSIGNLTIA